MPAATEYPSPHCHEDHFHFCTLLESGIHEPSYSEHLIIGGVWSYHEQARRGGWRQAACASWSSEQGNEDDSCDQPCHSL